MPNKRLRIGVSMREVNARGYHEPRDALARNWGDFLQIALPEAVWLPVPNLGAEMVRNFCTEWDLNGLILTGGEDVGISPMRDETERALLRFFVQHDQPILAVCRGLQLINKHIGGRLVPVEGHAAGSHPVSMAEPWHYLYGPSAKVNSYHDHGVPVDGVADGLMVTATDAEGNVEGVCHPERSLAAVMWHPERDGGLDGDRLLLAGLAEGNMPWQ